MDTILSVVTHEDQPNLNYFNSKINWQEYVSRTPDEFEMWYNGAAREVTDYAVAAVNEC